MDHAFTDQMVRADPSLREAAEKYLLDYKGSFQPILEARRVLQEGIYELNVAEIRTVLNVMRADTSIRIEYEPPQGNVIQFPRRQRLVDEQEVTKAKPKLEVPIRSRIKFDYGTSLNRQAQVIHDIDHEGTEFAYKRAGARTLTRRGWEVFWYDRIEVKLKWSCSAAISRQPMLLLVNAKTAGHMIMDGYRRACPQCKKVADA